MKKFLSLVLVLSIFANNSIVYAYDDKKPASENDITTWRQSDAIWSENSKTYLNEDLKEYTIKEAGCGLFAISYMLYKSGKMGENVTPLTVLDKVREKDIWDDKAKGYHIDGTKIEEICSDFSVAVDFSSQLWKYSLADKTKEEVFAILKELYNQGYFVIICLARKDSSSHYIFLDGFSAEDDFFLLDSLYPETHYKGSRYATDDYSFSYINVYSCSGISNNLLDSLYGEKLLQEVELSSWEKKYIQYLRAGYGRDKKWLRREDFY